MFWYYVRQIAVYAATFYAVSKVGPPAVDKYFLPTIEYVAGTFHAVAPQPAPATTFVNMPTPMAASASFTISKTVFVRQAGYETMSRHEEPTATGIHQGQWPFVVHQILNDDFPSQRDGLLYWLPSLFDWYSRIICEASHTVLLHLRQLFDNFLFQVATFASVMVSWKLQRSRSQMNINKIRTLHDQEVVGIQQHFSASAMVKDLEIASLNVQKKAQRDQFDIQKTLLDKATEEAQLAKKAKTMAEEQSNQEIAKLNSSLTDKDKTIAERDDSLAKATERAETAEKSKKALEINSRKGRSDFDSTLQKKENDINAHKRASEKATKDSDAARRELKDASAQAGKDRKKVAELEKGVTGLTKKTAELEAQVKQKDVSIRQTDGILTKMEAEKQILVKDVANATAGRDTALKKGISAKAKDDKLISELQNQVTEANSLRKVAEAKASKHEASLVEAARQRATETLNASKTQEALASDMAAVRADLDTERALRLDAQREKEETEDRVDAFQGQVADLLEENAVLGATLDGMKKEKTDGNEEGEEESEHNIQETVDHAPVGSHRSSGAMQYNRNKLFRKNKRADGSIRTSNNPQYTPPRGQAVDQGRLVDKQKLLKKQQPRAAERTPAQEEPRAQVPISAPIQQETQRQARQICPYFQHGNCKFGARCFDLHELPRSSGNPSRQTEEPIAPAPVPAPVQKADHQEKFQRSTPKPVKPTCSFFKRGHCRFGAKCHDSHDLSGRK